MTLRSLKGHTRREAEPAWWAAWLRVATLHTRTSQATPAGSLSCNSVRGSFGSRFFCRGGYGL